MKRMLVFFVMALFLSSPQAHAGKTVPSKITGVTLYSNQALLQREASADVGVGINELHLPVRAFSIDSSSAFAKVFGKGKIISVQVRSIPRSASPREKIRRLEETIEKLREDKQALLDKKASVSRQEKFLDSVVEFSETQMSKEIETRMLDSETLNNTFELLGNRFHEIFKKKTAIDKDISSIEKDILTAHRELRDLRQSEEKEQKRIELVFDSTEKQQIRIIAKYLAYNASWSPVYRVSVPDERSGVELTMNARIVQKTGADWSDVHLSVSNAVALRGVSIPTLHPWRLDLPRPRAEKTPRHPSGKGVAALGSAKPKAVMLKESRMKTDRADYAAARRLSSGISFEYELSRPVTVESRKKVTLLPLYTKDLDGEFYYYCVPRKNPRAYLVCEAEPDQEMLPGPMHIHFGTHYMGKTRFRSKSRGEKFLLPLGADRGVRVRRQKVTDHVKETFFGKFERNMVVREFGYRLTIENRKEKPIRMHVLDQIPVAKTDKIDVDDVSFEPAPQEADDRYRPGIKRWEMGIGPQKTESIDIRFTVAYPKDQPPVGL
ncbi:MAG: mucoidy inhibitor MuiA family protein [Desulfobacterales bacterium]|nr:mucoidy inhibitor MuiA family protein [Desulfobacterales bacterium]